MTVGNAVRDLVLVRGPDERAVVTLDADGTREEWTFDRLGRAAGAFAATLADHGVDRGTVVLTLVGSRIEYVLTILAGLWLGAPVLPCSEQLRPKDIALRLERARPGAIVCDPRNRAVLDAAGPSCPVLAPDPAQWAGDAAPPFAELGDLDPAFVLFTSGTSGEPKLVTHGQRYVTGQQLQATQWMAARPGELVWSTAAPGWSKAARNSFLAPWFGAAAALLQDTRFDAAQRLATIRAEGVDVLCMAPTEYRLIAAAGPIDPLPTLRRAVTAGEPLGVPAFEAWRTQTGLEISDGYGQTETGQITGVRPGETAPPGSMGRALPGIDVEIVDGELTLDPATVPTFFLGYDGAPVPAGRWHTGDQVRQDADGWLFFESRADDVIISAGYRIGPTEVESALQSHPAVRECAVLGVPDAARGSVVGAAVVVKDDVEADDALVAELQAHVRAETAPYKYPRRVWFVDELPKTTSGKIHRAALRPPPPT
ncbi:acyl-CoA synthetase [uncultured Jatrophihabitans sp.]|uniref:acyl-CoA synthetase n=1 Tax=uncultured Jatrophihabitans sp. TaxID=1610747 RepID=UPI0035CC4286